jgi:hypothetical protein
MFDPDVAYAPALWSSFLSAEVSASAALTGLLFVAVSINLAKIIEFPHLTPRAAKALATLVGVLFAASFCLVPGQSREQLGLELTGTGVLAWVAVTWTQYRHSRGNPYVSKVQRWFDRALVQTAAIPVVLCGVSLICGRGGGLYWLVAGVVLSFVCALLDAWVLLIEIQR